MQLSSSFLILGLGLLSSGWCAASDPADEFTRVSTTSIAIESTTVLPPTVGGPALVLPIRCGSDGTIYTRLSSGGGVQDLVGIRPDGKAAISFDRTKISDVPNARPVAFFPSDDGVFLLLNAVEHPVPQTVRLKTPSGAIHEQSGLAGTRVQYVARFDLRGEYKGSIRLDLSFRAEQFAVFPNGSMVVSGFDENGQKSRVALVQANGQFDRNLELKEDVELSSDAIQSNSRELQIPAEGALRMASAKAELLALGDSVLMFRRGFGSPVFRISVSGEVSRTPVRPPKGFGILSIVPEKGRWLVRFSHQDKESGTQVATYRVDPQTGVPTEKLVFDTAVGLGLGCSSNGRLSILKMGSDGRVLLLTGSAD